MTKKKKQEQEVISEVSVYVIDERTNNIIIILNNIDVPCTNDHFVIYKENIAIELVVTGRSLVVNANTNIIAWNVYVLPIGSPWEIEVEDNKSSKNKTSKDDSDNELAS